MARILDLGCGAGDSWRKIGVEVSDRDVIGMDIDSGALRTAQLKYKDRGWSYVCARGANLFHCAPAASMEFCAT
jgi:ubiquinone/menaquinone biosynthesis C-methylase UbiE